MNFCNSLESCTLTYNITDYDIVIINFTIEQGLDVLNYIQRHNPKQRIITLSEELVPSVKDEHHCKTHYNKRRLLKPVNNSELIHTIQNFDTLSCKYEGKFGCAEGIISILGDVLRRFDGVGYDITKHEISVCNSKSIVDVTKFLTDKGIKFKVHEQKIKIES